MTATSLLRYLQKQHELKFAKLLFHKSPNVFALVCGQLDVPCRDGQLIKLIIIN